MDHFAIIHAHTGYTKPYGSVAPAATPTCGGTRQPLAPSAHVTRL
jgi:hypothetical protein